MASMEAVGWLTVGPNVKIPSKIIFKRFVKMTDHTYAYNNFTILQYLNMKCMSGNGIHVTLLKLDGKGELILGGF